MTTTNTTRQAVPPSDVLTDLLKEYGKYLRRACRGMCEDAELWQGEAEDLYQNTWLKVAKYLEKRWPRAESADQWKWWLRRIARNLLLDQCKEAGRREVRERTYGSAIIERRTASPSNVPVGATLADHVRTILQKHCTEVTQQVGELRLAKVPYRQIAAELGIKEIVAREAAQRAMNILRRELRAMGWSVP